MKNTCLDVYTNLVSHENVKPEPSIISLYLNTVSKYGHKEALSAKGKDGRYHSMTYNELNHKVISLSLVLINFGINAGDNVALLSENRPEWVISDLGIISAGAVNVPIYPTLNINQIKYILNDCQAKAIIVSTMQQAEKILQIEEDLPDLRHMIVMDDDVPIRYCNKLKVIKFKELFELSNKVDHGIAQERSYRIHNIREDDVASIVYTSGTTGEPKGVMLTNKNFISDALSVVKIVNLTPDYKELSFLPLAHALERVVYYCILFTGCSIAYAESINKVSDNLKEVKPSIIVSVPRLFEKVYKKIFAEVNKSSKLKQKLFYSGLELSKKYHELKSGNESIPMDLLLKYKFVDTLIFSAIRKEIGSNLRLIVSGGAPLKNEIAEFFSLIGLNISTGYGLTETSPVLTVNPPLALRHGTVGPAIDGVELKIAEDGEILAKGPNLMKGYYNKPEQTAEVIDADGWFHTGDIGHLDENGYLIITDRKKDLIVTSNGKKIPPQPLENKLKECNYIEQVVVIGDNRPYMTALVVTDPVTVKEYAKENSIEYRSYEELIKNDLIYKLIETDIKELCKDFSKFEQIKKFNILEKELSVDNDELTPTLKYRRKIISKKYADVINSMYTGT